MTEPTDFVYNVMVINRCPSSGDDYVWVNRHQITADAGLLGDQQRLQDLADAFVTYHKYTMYEHLYVDRVVVSTYGPDLPWPAGFASIPANAQGVIGAGSWGEMLPLEVALFVRRNVTRGRDGKLFLRGCIGRNQVDRFGNITTALINHVNGHGTQLLASLQAQDVQMVMASGPVAAIQTRQVLSLEVVNFRTLQFRAKRKSSIRRYQLSQFLQGTLSETELAQAWDLLDDLGVNPSRLLPGPDN